MEARLILDHEEVSQLLSWLRTYHKLVNTVKVDEDGDLIRYMRKLDSFLDACNVGDSVILKDSVNILTNNVKTLTDVVQNHIEGGKNE